MTHSSGMRYGSGVATPQSSMPSTMQSTNGHINGNALISSVATRPTAVGGNNINSLQKVPSSSAINRKGTLRPAGNVPVASNGVSKLMNRSNVSKNMMYNNIAITGGGSGSAGACSATTNLNNVAKNGLPMNPHVGKVPNAPGNALQTMNNGMRPNLAITRQPSVGDMGNRSNSQYGNNLNRNDSFSGNSANKNVYGVQSEYGSMGVSTPAVNGVYMMPNNQGSGYGGFGQD